jgi:hypothetical protein
MMILAFLGLSSCKKDSNSPANCSANWAVEVQDEITALSNAAMAYSSGPTAETCIAYKNAYQDYIDVLKPLKNCATYTAQQKADLQQAIDEAEDDISTLCDE